MIDQRTDRVQHRPVYLLNACRGRVRDIDMNVDLRSHRSTVPACERDRDESLRPRGGERVDDIR